MARTAATDDGKPAAPKKPSMISVVIEMAFLTCFAVGAGGLFGMMVLGGADKASAKPEPAVASSQKSKQVDTITVKTLPAIVTNLAGPKKAWIRLEAAIADDFVAYLRTVPLAQIEGPSGFLHLREDLNERARIRSGGKVKELVVQSLMLE
jgi:flagellar FliL protein